MQHIIIQRARSLRKNLTDAERKLWREIRCNKLDGSQHADDDAVRYDEKRTHCLESIGYKVIRFWNHEIFQEIERVKEVIPPSFPSPCGGFVE